MLTMYIENCFTTVRVTVALRVIRRLDLGELKLAG